MQNFNWIEIATEAQRKKLKPGNINYIRHEMLSEKTERIGTAVLNAACKVYKNLGPGLLEKVYEVCLPHEIKKAGFEVFFDR